MNKLIHLLKKSKVLLPCLMLVTSVTPVHACIPCLVVADWAWYAATTTAAATTAAGAAVGAIGGKITSNVHDARLFTDEDYWDKQRNIDIIWTQNNAKQYKKYLNSFNDNDRAKKMYDTLADITINIDEFAFPYTLEPADALRLIYNKTQTINQDEQIIGPNTNSKQFIEYYAKLITASVATKYLNSKNNFEFTELTQKVSEKSKEVLEYILNIKMIFAVRTPLFMGGGISTHYYGRQSYLQMINSLTNCIDIGTYSDTKHSCGYKLNEYDIDMYDPHNHNHDLSNYDLPKYLSRLIDETVRNYNVDQNPIGEASDTVSTGGPAGGDDPGKNNIPTTIYTDQSSNSTQVKLMSKMFVVNGRLYMLTPDYIRNEEEVSRWANTNGGNIIVPQEFDKDDPTTHPNTIEITGFVCGGGGFCCTTQDSSRERHAELNGDGWSYSGGVRNGQPYGIGIMRYANGDRYIGEWANGQRTNGEIYYINGGSYEGEWLNDLPHGNGEMTYANGDRYIGGWANGQRTGNGVMTYDNDIRYEGTWVDGQPNGHGIARYANGNIYDGVWVDGQQTGHGEMTYDNDDRYYGTWLNGQRTGNGVMRYANGDRYIGGWANGQQTGHGEMTYDNEYALRTEG
jgi:hypothetical protein